MNFIRWILSALLIMFIAWLVPGITVSNYLSAMFAVVIIALVNIFIKPLIVFISFPINFLTVGLFGFVINALLFMLAGKITPGLEVESFWSALLGSLLLSVFTPIIADITDKKNK